MFLMYVVYRSFRWLFMYCSNLFTYQYHAETSAQVENFKIHYKYKYLICDIARECDFVYTHQHWMEAAKLQDAKWSIYCIDAKYIYWVKLDRPEYELTSKKSCFMYYDQFLYATEVGRMTITEFIRFGECLKMPEGRIVYFASVPRAGTTLLAQILQAADNEKVVTYAEPDIFVILARCYQSNELNLPMEDFIKLVKASVLFCCRTMKPGQTYILKTRSQSSKLIPAVFEAFGKEIHYIFMCRKDLKLHLASGERMILVCPGGELMVRFYLVLCTWMPQIAKSLFGWLPFLVEDIVKYKIRDYFEIVTWTAFESYRYFLENRNAFSELIYGPLRYEDITTDADKLDSQQRLKTVFSICGLDPESAESARRDCVKVDSQEGTWMSQKSTGHWKTTELNESNIRIAKNFTPRLNIPEEFWDQGVMLLDKAQ